MNESHRKIKIKQKRNKILFFGIIVLLLFSISAIDLRYSYINEIEHAYSDAKNISYQSQVQFQKIFTKIDRALIDTILELKTKNNLEDWNSEELTELMANKKKQIPESQNLFVVDRNGVDKLRFRFGERFNLSDRDYFYKQALSNNNELVFSKPIISRETGRYVVILSRKIVDSENKFLGIVASGIPLSFFSDYFGKLNLVSGTVMSFSSLEGLLYSRHPWNEELIGKVFIYDEVLNKFFINQAHFDKTQKIAKKKISQIFSYQQIGTYPFYVSIDFSKIDYMKIWILKCVVYMSIFFILFGFSINFLLSYLREVEENERLKKVADQSLRLVSLGDLTESIALELNDPVSSITGQLNQVMRSIDADSIDKKTLLEDIKSISFKVDKISRILQNLSEFSSVSDSDPMKSVSLRKIVDSAIEFSKVKFKSSSVVLKINEIPDVVINCREAQITQVIINILSNAFEAVENLNEQWVLVSFEKDLDKIKIKITDSGEGIPGYIEQSIMQPFFTTKAEKRGVGLGLPFSKSVIENHNGEIYLDKTSSNTCFVIELNLSSLITSQ